MVEKVYEFGEGKVREHLGGIYDFLQSKKIDSLTTLELSKNVSSPDPEPVAKTENKLNYAERKELQKQLNRIEKAIKETEKDIEKYETRVKELEEILLKPEHASDMGLINEYTNITAQLEKANEKWLELSEEKEQINID